jgi:hypothetical protein
VQRVAVESHTGRFIISRGRISKMGGCICYESWWTKMNGPRAIVTGKGKRALLLRLAFSAGPNR